MSVPTNFMQFNTATGYLYRACWMASYLSLTTPAVVSAAQRDALLLAWNSDIKFTGQTSVATLAIAAAQSEIQLNLWWQTGNTGIKQPLVLFGGSLLSIFAESSQATNPVSNWGIIISALASQIA